MIRKSFDYDRHYSAFISSRQRFSCSPRLHIVKIIVSKPLVVARTCVFRGYSLYRVAFGGQKNLEPTFQIIFKSASYKRNLCTCAGTSRSMVLNVFYYSETFRRHGQRCSSATGVSTNVTDDDRFFFLSPKSTGDEQSVDSLLCENPLPEAMFPPKLRSPQRRFPNGIWPYTTSSDNFVRPHTLCVL